MSDDVRFKAIAVKMGEFKVKAAFMSSTFVYGTQGKGGAIVKGLNRWAAQTRLKSQARAQAQQGSDPAALKIKAVFDRELNLFDPGRRAEAYLRGGHQMMDMYYGQEGNAIHDLRNPVITEFVHYAMGYTTPFVQKDSGRAAYFDNFKDARAVKAAPGVQEKKAVEGWAWNTPSTAKYDGLTATKEISRIIRWGIRNFGGTLIFEGRELFYSQVFDTTAARTSDTDLEAQELFKYFTPGASRVAFGKGTIVFHWAGKETVPTKYHFLTNWKFGGLDKDNKPLMHVKSNVDAPAFERNPNYRPIWNNFQDVPVSLAGIDKTKLLQFLQNHRPLGI